MTHLEIQLQENEPLLPRNTNINQQVIITPIKMYGSQADMVASDKPVTNTQYCLKKCVNNPDMSLPMIMQIIFCICYICRPYYNAYLRDWWTASCILVHEGNISIKCEWNKLSPILCGLFGIILIINMWGWVKCITRRKEPDEKPPSTHPSKQCIWLYTNIATVFLMYFSIFESKMKLVPGCIVFYCITFMETYFVIETFLLHLMQQQCSLQACSSKWLKMALKMVGYIHHRMPIFIVLLIIIIHVVEIFFHIKPDSFMIQVVPAISFGISVLVFFNVWQQLIMTDDYNTATCMLCPEDVKKFENMKTLLMTTSKHITTLKRYLLSFSIMVLMLVITLYGTDTFYLLLIFCQLVQFSWLLHDKVEVVEFKWRCCKCRAVNTRHVSECANCQFPIINDDWECDLCTAVNAAASDKCQICGTQKANESNNIVDTKTEMNATHSTKEANCAECKMNISECELWKRVQSVLNYFQDNIDFDDMFYTSKIYNTRVALMNDYIHIVTMHDVNEINEISEECSCTKYMNRDNLKRNRDKKESRIGGLMGQIHCFVYHNINRDDHEQKITTTKQEEKHKEQNNYEEKNDIEEENKYCESDDDENHEFGFGTFMHYGWLQPKFESLKEETLNRNIYPMTNDDWDEMYDNAQIWLSTSNAKANKLQIGHIIAIKMYTDSHNEQYEFRKSFRPHNKNETDQDVMERHRKNFYHWGRNLLDAVTNCGTEMKENIPYYHGLSAEFLFPSLLNKDLNIPTSLTTERRQAEVFAPGGGIILQLKPRCSQSNYIKILPVFWMSRFPDEKESLLFGNHNKLIIYDIFTTTKYISNQKRIATICNFEAICKGDVYEEDYEKYLDDLIELFKYKMNQFGQDEEIKDYLTQLFDSVWQNQKSFSIKSFSNMPKLQSAMNELILNNQINKTNFFHLKCEQCDSKLSLKKNTIFNKNVMQIINFECFGCNNNSDIVCSKYLIDCRYGLCWQCANTLSFLRLILPTNAKFGLKKDQVTDKMKQNATDLTTKLAEKQVQQTEEVMQQKTNIDDQRKKYDQWRKCVLSFN